MKKVRIPFASIGKKITGISTPIGGISWEPPALEADVVRKLVTFLEDRRVLYVPFIMEVPDQVTTSVLEIRKRLSEDLEKLDRSSPLAEKLRLMRSACMNFLTEDPGSRHRFRLDDFFQRLGEFRSVFGILLGQLSAIYKIDLGEELASMVPELSESDEDRPETQG